MEEKTMDAVLELIEAYAGTLTNYIKENGNASLGAVTNDVMALESLMSAVNTMRRV